MLACGGTSSRRCLITSDHSSSPYSQFVGPYFIGCMLTGEYVGQLGHIRRTNLHQIPVRVPNDMTYIGPDVQNRHDPFYATFILIGILGMFKPYPTLADAGLFLSMISLFPETHQCEAL